MYKYTCRPLEAVFVIRTTDISFLLAAEKRDLEGREEAAVAAQTVTYTQTTFTVTQTVVTTIPPKTTTELAFRTLTTTM